MKKILTNAYLYLLLVILYAPIAIIVIFSFTNSKTIGDWKGFSLDLYTSLLTGGAQHASAISTALLNTIIIALVAASLSTIRIVPDIVHSIAVTAYWRVCIQIE